MGVTKYPRLINDEDLETDWCSDFELPAACTVEFDDEYTIVWVRCVTRYHTQTYRIELSADGKTWEQVGEHTSSDLKASGEDEGIDDYHIGIGEHRARYMRVVVTKTDAPATHIFQACVAELQAVGYKGSGAPVEVGEITLTIPGTAVQLKMRLIPAGTFMMGSPGGEILFRRREDPQHQVTITSHSTWVYMR